jgi:outer membrane lipoprotein-sorting protein
MNQYRIAACALSLLAASSAFAAGLNATQVIERNVAARGGLEAWHAVTSLKLTGQMDAGGSENARLPFELTLARPNKSRLELKFQDKTALQIYDGTQGWKVRPFLNRDEVENFTPTEAKVAATAGELDGFLIDYSRKGYKVEARGSEPIEGKPAYKLLLTGKGGEQRMVWVDEGSFLEVKVDGEPRKLDGKLHKVWVYYRDYKTVKGLSLPRTLETVVDGVEKHHTMTVETVVVNPPLTASMFAKPPLPTARVAAQ